jgi:hypothetical protein
MRVPDRRRVLCFATQGAAHTDSMRLRYLLEPLQPEVYPFDRARKLRSAVGLARTMIAQPPDVVVMEGTGMAGGFVLLVNQVLLGVPFIVSSGDAVGPYLGLRSRFAGAVGHIYERVLCRRCAGYVGWTPYLVGRGLTFGAPRAMTAPGWTRGRASSSAREEIRCRLGIPKDALVVGLAGSLNWRERVGYTYGAELVSAVRRVKRRDIVACIVGDGSGRGRLEEMAGEDLGSRVLLPGRVPPEEVVDYLAAFDVASLPQSVDGVGSFRYTTKLSEYLAAELPVVTGQTPVAYDLDEGYFWRLPGRAPWDPAYVAALVRLLEALTAVEIAERHQAILRQQADPFDQLSQQRRMSEFIRDILAERS